MITAARTESARQVVGFDVLTAHWRSAFAVAAEALQVASGCRESLGFAARELDERRGRLLGEREATSRLLAVIAHEEHISVQLPL